MPIPYIDLDLEIERTANGYHAEITDSPGGQASSDFTLPFSDLELENFLLRLGGRRSAARRVETPEMEAAKSFGNKLFNAVFAGDMRSCLNTSQFAAEQQGAGLRIRLRLTGAPELADLPWEYLYNSTLNRFLSLSVKTPLVRYLDLPERIRPLTVKLPLRVLVMISSPSDYPQLDVEGEFARLSQALSDVQSKGLVILERLQRASLATLSRRLRDGEFHVFHFIGHGAFDDRTQDGMLVLEDAEGKGRLVSAQYLGTVLHDHISLRLAVLNSCEGARTSRADPFAGAAQSLVQQGIPAVIAMQFEISDQAALLLSQEFYGALVQGYPVDGALAEARKTLFAEGNELEWGTPVLYLRAPDGRIFDVQESSPAELAEAARRAHAEKDTSATVAPLPVVERVPKTEKREEPPTPEDAYRRPATLAAESVPQNRFHLKNLSRWMLVLVLLAFAFFGLSQLPGLIGNSQGIVTTPTIPLAAEATATTAPVALATAAPTTAPAAAPTVAPTVAPIAAPTTAPTTAPVAAPPNSSGPCARLSSMPSVGPGELGSSRVPIEIYIPSTAGAADVTNSSQRIADCLSSMTGLTYHIQVIVNNGAAVDAVRTNKAQVAFLNVFSMLLALERYGGTPALSNLRTYTSNAVDPDKDWAGNLAPFYKAQFIANVASGIHSFSDLNGKTFCFVDPLSTTGYIVPRIVLQANGIDPDRDFRATSNSGSHPNVAVAVYKGDCDAGVTFIDVLTDKSSNLQARYPDILDKVRPFADTDRVPNDGVVYASKFTGAQADATTTALVALVSDPDNRAVLSKLYSVGLFKKADLGLYQGFLALFQKVGVDVSTFVK